MLSQRNFKRSQCHYFFFSKRFWIAVGNVKLQHAHLDLILTTEPYKRTIYSTKQLLNKKDMKIYADESGCYPPHQAASKTCMILIFILSYGKFAKPT